MSIKVKRKLWIFAALIPLRIKYNNESVGALYGSQEMEIPTHEDKGELKYYQPVGRNDQLQVKSGDVVQIEETLLGKGLSILLALFMIYIFLKVLRIIDYTVYLNYEAIIQMELIVFGIIFFIGIIGLFFKTHKLVLLNR
ncbi:hypothetical protein [Jeotgalicoccus psychrophilus]|uniref:hypothetical protein n=1 Tax=Jeotgalicoccus psychrophilus TaxID=157228 RepID=UPI0004250CFB|nr:hypothetical protein [Jeotgalicoccus psychrophilus]